MYSVAGSRRNTGTNATGTLRSLPAWWQEMTYGRGHWHLMGDGVGNGFESWWVGGRQRWWKGHSPCKKLAEARAKDSAGCVWGTVSHLGWPSTGNESGSNGGLGPHLEGPFTFSRVCILLRRQQGAGFFVVVFFSLEVTWSELFLDNSPPAECRINWAWKGLGGRRTVKNECIILVQANQAGAGVVSVGMERRGCIYAS